VNRVEGRDELRIKRQSVSLKKLEWIIRLGHDIDPNNGKTRPTIANAGTTSAAEKIEQLRLSYALPFHFIFSILNYQYHLAPAGVHRKSRRINHLPRSRPSPNLARGEQMAKHVQS
jgi:hypothetical protein